MINYQASIIRDDCLEHMRKVPDRTYKLTFGSPPYPEKGQRYVGSTKKWKTEEWVEWMLEVTKEAIRITDGYVLWIGNGAVKKSRYLPGVEGLIWRMHLQGFHCERPCIWTKNAPPNRRNWFGNNWEYVAAFRNHETKEFHFDWEAIAEPPKYKAGGRFRQRNAKGERRLGNEYPQNKLARPRDVFRFTVGGGHMGSDLAHESEAPFPLDLAENFIKVLCPPNGIVFDPFGGSGTTLHAAVNLSRPVVCLDNRQSQIDLMNRRLTEAVRTAHS